MSKKHWSVGTILNSYLETYQFLFILITSETFTLLSITNLLYMDKIALVK